MGEENDHQLLGGPRPKGDQDLRVTVKEAMKEAMSTFSEVEVGANMKEEEWGRRKSQSLLTTPTSLQRLSTLLSPPHPTKTEQCSDLLHHLLKGLFPDLHSKA